MKSPLPRWDGNMKNEGKVVIVTAFSSLRLVDSQMIASLEVCKKILSPILAFPWEC